MAEKITTDSDLCVRVQMKIPTLPNFIISVDGRSIDLKDIPDGTLRKIGEQWTEKLILHARKRKGIGDA